MCACVRARLYAENVNILIIVLYISSTMTALDVTQFKICLQFVFVWGGSILGQRFYRRFEGCGAEKGERAVSGIKESQSANVARGILCLA